MLADRACPGGGFNAGNGVVFDSALPPQVDTTAIALLALDRGTESAATPALGWLRVAYTNCRAAYSLAGATLAFLAHRDPAADLCASHLYRAFTGKRATLDIETLSLAAIALHATDRGMNRFEVL
jgi:hypothetical protein